MFSTFNNSLLSYLHLCPKQQKAQLSLYQKARLELGVMQGDILGSVLAT
jgi:hypothetical protein